MRLERRNLTQGRERAEGRMRAAAEKSSTRRTLQFDPLYYTHPHPHLPCDISNTLVPRLSVFLMAYSTDSSTLGLANLALIRSLMMDRSISGGKMPI